LDAFDRDGDEWWRRSYQRTKKSAQKRAFSRIEGFNLTFREDAYIFIGFASRGG